MTGHGSGTAESELVQALVEIRSVNNRFLKISVAGDIGAEQQSKLESLLKSRVQRGSISVRVQLQFLEAGSQYRINVDQIQAYRDQLDRYLKSSEIAGVLGDLLALPGVVTEIAGDSRLESAWPTIEEAAVKALDSFIEMRSREGQAMLDDLLGNCDLISRMNASIQARAPKVIEGYAAKITERINRLLKEHDASVSKSELIREVGVFAERVDISEELVRLASHVDQFRSIANGPQSDGRKLDFLVQEMLRETNTIGSKANDAEIAGQVVEMKTAIERIREMIQNVE